MADDTNEDSWLYGTSNPDSTTNEDERVDVENAGEETGVENIDSQELSKAENEALAAVIQGSVVNDLQNEDGGPAEDAELADFEDPAREMEEDEEATAAATVADTTDREDNTETQDEKDEGPSGEKENHADDDEEDDDDSDDDINVVIDVKSAPSTYNIKQRSNLLAGASNQEKSKTTQVGKFSIEDFEGVGAINGVAAHEFSIDSLEDKPWRKPGADITDYFNYGFNEETWRSYCERQKRFRVAESGVGLASLTQNLNPPAERQGEGNMPTGPPLGALLTNPIPIGTLGEQIQMPPPGIIAQPGMHQSPIQSAPRFTPLPRGPRPVIQPGTKENAIQVMTAECREYSRTGQMLPSFGGPGPVEDAFFHEPEPFDYGYEPTQDSQWGGENPNWVPSGIKELTPGPNSGPPQQMSGPPGILPTPMGVPPPQMSGPPPQMRHPIAQAPIMGGMPPPNINMGPPPIGMMMGPSGPGGSPMRMPMGPPRMVGPNVPLERSDDDRERRRREREWERERERDRERERSRRERSRSREKSRRRSKSRDKERDKERDKDRDKDRDRERDRERERERERDRGDKVEENERSDDERERRRRDRERERERDRERERSRRERSKSREKSRRRSKSRDKERDRSSKTGTSSSSSSRSDKKKSHRKEEEE